MTELPGLDLTRLAAHLDRAGPGLFGGALTGEVIAGGRSNLTYRVSDGRRTLVLRRPPLGHVLATAHDMGREVRVLRALATTAVPVPAILHHCPDPGPVGAPFYLMEFVPGPVHRTAAELARLGPAGVRTLALALVDTLADLHAVDPAGVGLADFGVPAGFAARQVRRWKRQLDASRSRDLPGVDELHARLAATVPTAGPGTVLHGDLRADNVVAGDLRADDVVADDLRADDGPAGGHGPAEGTTGGRRAIRAVLDWEMSTLGDPLTDLGLTLVHAGRVRVPGQPGTDELAARYARRSGRSLDDLPWYLAFGAYKLAVILEGVHYRYVRGQTIGEGFDTVGERVLPLVTQGLRELARR
ncbi:aminoglycoside phosphotransferase (APT) family kinase protein [Micromonospora sp. Llam0]|uniref:phosphotransferase family protein n=1 Tax=Micromonospora sp. Llam0 TaxID=2485143 RepID=UPI000F49CEFB|nr:phosphotransferase family protein [Micromonospora sp. Llam0]ROO58826.1 aminoglycoside phosphotransferase (APT) family kinase protein [Micromonospora sp. Llam0]